MIINTAWVPILLKPGHFEIVIQGMFTAKMSRKDQPRRGFQLKSVIYYGGQTWLVRTYPGPMEAGFR